MQVSQPIGTNGLMLPLKQVRPGIRQFDRCDSTLWTAATSAQTPRSGIDARHRRRQSRIKIAALIDIDRADERITERRMVRVRHLAPDQGCIGDLQRGRERHRLADRVGRAVERVAPGNCPLTTGIRGYLRDGDHHARSRVGATTVAAAPRIVVIVLLLMPVYCEVISATARVASAVLIAPPCHRPLRCFPDTASA
jgi:hypothetical protein